MSQVIIEVVKTEYLYAMNQSKALHPFLEGFRTEHQEILEDLKTNFEQSDWNRFFQHARQNVELKVEMEEELFLFPAIAQKADINAGGPLCMLYYGMNLNGTALDQSAAATGLAKLDPAAGGLLERRRPFFEVNSPVCIPLKDHMAGEQIVAQALSLLELKPANNEHLSHLAYIYLNILKLHFEKEDNCLLPMAQSLLSTLELDTLLRNSAVWRSAQQ